MDPTTSSRANSGEQRSASAGRADLHNHTTASDGDLTPTALVGRAADLGLAALGVTDHDTIEGLPEALEAGARCGVEVVCGVEVTLRFTEPAFRGSLHVLVYFAPSNLSNDDFLSQTRDVLALGRGTALNRARLEALNGHFGPGGPEPLLERPLTEADLLRHGERISRRHFARALSEQGHDREAVTRMIGNASPAYVPSGMTVGDLAVYLRRWPQTVRVLAHPAAGSFPGEGHYKEVLPPLETVERLMPRFAPLALDGLEAAYPGHTPELEQRVRDLAATLGLTLVTGGSDCHDASQRPLGVASVPMDAVDRIRALWAARGRAGHP